MAEQEAQGSKRTFRGWLATGIYALANWFFDKICDIGERVDDGTAT